MCIFFFHWTKSRTLEENVKNYRCNTRQSLMYNEKYNEKCKKKHRVCLSADYEMIKYGKVDELIYFILFLLLDNTNTDCLL